MRKTRCAVCRTSTPAAIVRDVPWRLGIDDGPGEVVIRDVPAARCVACGRVTRTAGVSRRAELLAAVELADRGVHDGRALRFMRKALRLSSSELAELLDVTRETMSRWENNRFTIVHSAWIMVAALVSDRLAGSTTTLDRLSALRSSRDRHPHSIVVPFVRRTAENRSTASDAAASSGIEAPPSTGRSPVTALGRDGEELAGQPGLTILHHG